MSDLKEFYSREDEDDLNKLVEEAKNLIEEGSEEWRYAHYALFRFRILPWELAELPKTEKAVIYAMIDLELNKQKMEVK